MKVYRLLCLAPTTTQASIRLRTRNAVDIHKSAYAVVSPPFTGRPAGGAGRQLLQKACGRLGEQELHVRFVA